MLRRWILTASLLLATTCYLPAQEMPAIRATFQNGKQVDLEWLELRGGQARMAALDHSGEMLVPADNLVSFSIDLRPALSVVAANDDLTSRLAALEAQLAAARATIDEQDRKIDAFAEAVRSDGEARSDAAVIQDLRARVDELESRRTTPRFRSLAPPRQPAPLTYSVRVNPAVGSSRSTRASGLTGSIESQGGFNQYSLRFGGAGLNQNFVTQPVPQRPAPANPTVTYIPSTGR